MCTKAAHALPRFFPIGTAHVDPSTVLCGASSTTNHLPRVPMRTHTISMRAHTDALLTPLSCTPLQPRCLLASADALQRSRLPVNTCEYCRTIGHPLAECARPQCARPYCTNHSRGCSHRLHRPRHVSPAVAIRWHSSARCSFASPTSGVITCRRPRCHRRSTTRPPSSP